MDISASLVKELREATGLGMMECKNALVEAHGDKEKAIDLLRVRSGAKAVKASSRTAAEGMISSANTPERGALVEVNCETDFVARNQDFIAFANELAAAAAARGVDNSDVLLEGSLEERRKALVMKLGENISVRRIALLSGKTESYLHGSRIGVLVSYEGSSTLARDVAMHVAAYKPLALDKTGMDAAAIERERAVYTEQASQSGKSPEIVAKMVEGRMSKYFAENTLLGQGFVKDPEQTVEKVLKAQNSSIKAFSLFVLGEGIEKKATDFASEVRAVQSGL